MHNGEKPMSDLSIDPTFEIHLRTLPLSHALPPTPGRPAYWLRGAAAVGARLPLFLARDLGALLTHRQPQIARPSHLPPYLDTTPYLSFLRRLAAYPLLRQVATWDVSDAVTGVLLARLVEDVPFPDAYAVPAGSEGAAFARCLAPLLDRADPAQLWRQTDPAHRPDLARLLPTDARAQIEANLRSLDADELRFLHRYGPRFAGAPDPRDLLDLFNLVGLPPGVRLALSQVLRLLPRVGQVSPTGGAQTYALGGYAGLTRKGSLDNLVPTELAYPRALFLHRVLNREALYYGREVEREGRREVAYLVTQAGLGMRGDGGVLARALTLALAQVMGRRGYAVRQSFVGSAWTEPAGVLEPGEVQRLLYYRDEGWPRYGEMVEAVLAQVRGWQEAYRGIEVLWVVDAAWDADGWQEREAAYQALAQRAGQQAWFVRVGKGRAGGNGAGGERPAAARAFRRVQVVESGTLWEGRELPRVIRPRGRDARRAWERVRDELEGLGFRDGVRDVLHFRDEERQLELWGKLAVLVDDPDQAAIDDYLRSLAPEGMVYVPAGPFLMGTTDEEAEALVAEFGEDRRDIIEREIPQHEVVLAGYYIGRHPVTNAQFAAFVAAAGYEAEAETGGGGWVYEAGWQQVEGADWRHPTGPESDIEGKGDHPVVQVSWNDARAYCDWLGARLPAEAEWEKAAGWDLALGERRRYPWGDEWDSAKCHIDRVDEGTAPVGAYSPRGDSAYGCAGMAGNVYDWCRTRWGTSGDQCDYPYPYDPEDGREDPAGGREMIRIVRGASWATNVEPVAQWARCAYRDGSYPWDWFDSLGFRVVAPRCLLVVDSES
jgi:formylglycine-generating enzyme required for sulfatase activity